MDLGAGGDIQFLLGVLEIKDGDLHGRERQTLRCDEIGGRGDPDRTRARGCRLPEFVPILNSEAHASFLF